tara:strand:+ start:197 stop:319 length:123 start_codon:yes stop_codon:yes gene_type:complete
VNKDFNGSAIQNFNSSATGVLYEGDEIYDWRRNRTGEVTD